MHPHSKALFRCRRELCTWRCYCTRLRFRKVTIILLVVLRFLHPSLLCRKIYSNFCDDEKLGVIFLSVSVIDYQGSVIFIHQPSYLVSYQFGFTTSYLFFFITKVNFTSYSHVVHFLALWLISFPFLTLLFFLLFASY